LSTITEGDDKGERGLGAMLPNATGNPQTKNDPAPLT